MCSAIACAATGAAAAEAMRATSPCGPELCGPSAPVAANRPATPCKPELCRPSAPPAANRPATPCKPEMCRPSAPPAANRPATPCKPELCRPAAPPAANRPATPCKCAPTAAACAMSSRAASNAPTRPARDVSASGGGQRRGARPVHVARRGIRADQYRRRTLQQHPGPVAGGRVPRVLQAGGLDRRPVDVDQPGQFPGVRGEQHRRGTRYRTDSGEQRQRVGVDQHRDFAGQHVLQQRPGQPVGAQARSDHPGLDLAGHRGPPIGRDHLRALGP